MSGFAPQFRTRTARPTVLAAVLVLVLLVPVGFLFLQSYDSVNDRRTATQREIEGVAYLRALGHLTFTITNAQAASVAGRGADQDAVSAAVSQVAAADDRYGDTLRTHDRWSGVRARIDSIRSDPRGDSATALSAYQEVTDLLLGLYGKVRDESGLSHDPDADAYQLQESVGANLPIAVIAAGRLADLNAYSSTLPQAQQLAALPDLAMARVTLTYSSNRLIDGLRAASDDTESRTLGGNVLSTLDRFQLTTQELLAAAGQVGQPSADASLVVLRRADVQKAAGDLSTTILNEVDRLLEARRDALTRDRWLLLAAGALALLLAVLAIVVLVLAARTARANARLAARASAPDERLPRQRTTGGPPQDPAAWGPARVGSVAQRERSGAAR
jgi:hypothetical protein